MAATGPARGIVVAQELESFASLMKWGIASAPQGLGVTAAQQSQGSANNDSIN